MDDKSAFISTFRKVLLNLTLGLLLGDHWKVSTAHQ